MNSVHVQVARWGQQKGQRPAGVRSRCRCWQTRSGACAAGGGEVRGLCRRRVCLRCVPIWPGGRRARSFAAAGRVSALVVVPSLSPVSGSAREATLRQRGIRRYRAGRTSTSGEKERGGARRAWLQPVVRADGRAATRFASTPPRNATGHPSIQRARARSQPGGQLTTVVV